MCLFFNILGSLKESFINRGDNKRARGLLPQPACLCRKSGCPQDVRHLLTFGLLFSPESLPQPTLCDVTVLGPHLMHDATHRLEPGDPQHMMNEFLKKVA